MASAQHSAIVYLKNARKDLIKHLHNFPLITENLYQRRVFNDHEVDALKAERRNFDKARFILDHVIKKGELASYELLRILDVTRKRTLHSDSHTWITLFPFREDMDNVYTEGTKPCHNYQDQLKKKANDFFKTQWEEPKRLNKYLKDKTTEAFTFISLVLDTDAELNSAENKIKIKNKKCKKIRPKKLKSYIPLQKQKLSPEDLLNSHEKRILLIGKPGIGKTAIVCQMLSLWTKKDSSELDYMFYFDESTLISNPKSLESLLFDIYKKPPEKERKEVLEDIEENSDNVIIVFDGISTLQNPIIKKIMEGDLLPDAKIVITCRSEEDNDFIYEQWSTLKVYIHGFSEESIQMYFTQMMGSDSDLLNTVLNNQELLSLCHVPMYAFMVAVCVSFNRRTPPICSNTVTEMYVHILRQNLMKAGNKTIRQVDKYMKDKRDHLFHLMECAFHAINQKTVIFSDTDCEETKISNVFLKKITVEDSVTSVENFYAFLHNTMQEFFSAMWLLCKADEIDTFLQLCLTKEKKHMKHVIPFLCGLVSEQNLKLLKNLVSEDQIKRVSDGLFTKVMKMFLQSQTNGQVEDEDDDVSAVLFLCQCLYESQSSEACLLFLDKVNYDLDLSGEDLDPHQCCAVSYVISQSRENKVLLRLEDCSISDTGIQMILRVASHLSFLSVDNRERSSEEKLRVRRFLVKVILQAALHQTQSLQTTVNTLILPCFKTSDEQCNFLLDLYSHVKDYETQTGRSVLPALQPVYQSAPAVWYIDLSKRKTSLFLEVLKLQTEKKPVKLRGWSDEESEVRSFLQCLPYISELSFDYFCCDDKKRRSLKEFLLKLTVAAAEWDVDTGESFTKLLMSVCSSPYFPLDEDYYSPNDQCNFLLYLYTHVKDYKTQTDRSVLPVLQPVYQSVPAVWNIDLSERKTSLFLDVLKLQTVKKPVVLRDWSDEESEVRSFLQCLPYMSKLSFDYFCCDDKKRRSLMEFLLNLTVAAAEWDVDTGESFTKLLMSVCSSPYFPLGEDHYSPNDQCNFLLYLYSHVKDYETQTGRSVLPALQPVYQSVPAVWNIDLSKRKTSLFLEVLKLQPKKKTVKLRDWSDEESEVRSFLQCLPYISELSFVSQENFRGFSSEEKLRVRRFLLNVILQAALHQTQSLQTTVNRLILPCFKTSDEQSNFLLDLYSHVKDYETQTGRSVLPALQPVYQSAPAVWYIDLSERKTSLFLEVLKLQTVKKPVELRGWSDEESEVRSFLQCLPYISHLRLSSRVVVRMVRALRVVRAPAPLTIQELSLILTDTQQTEGALSRVLSSLASLLRLWNVQCLNLTEYKMEAQSLTVLLSHQGPLTIRVCKETLQQLVVVVYEAQEEELTHCFLQKVGGDLMSCSLNWEVIHYFLQYQPVTVDFRKSNFKQQNPRELLTVLDRLQIRGLSSSFVLSIITEIYQTDSAHCVSSLLSSTENYINLNSRELDSVHCAALCFTLQHCTAVSLNLLFTSIPEGELESIVPLLTHVSQLSVDRLLLLRLLHCCSVYELQQGAAAAVLLSTLQHRLDFSCSSALDLTEDTQTHTLTLSTEDCRVVSMAIQRAHTHTHLTLHDCEIEEAGVEQLFPILHRVTLHCSKSMLLQFLSLVRVGTELECVKRSVALSRALGWEVDLSHTRLDQQACGSLALVLEHSEGLSELDLSHCQLTDDCLQLLFPHLHKTDVLDLSHNDITDRGAAGVYSAVSSNSNMQVVRLFNNKITDRRPFMSDQRFEIW